MSKEPSIYLAPLIYTVFQGGGQISEEEKFFTRTPASINKCRRNDDQNEIRDQGNFCSGCKNHQVSDH